ncbi:MAG TPA: septal ring lytic transglycosylase RlpA family protein [Candidatus Acidoferrales bacterium]|nr:septal ring lytic transglycosylase RlpA family protein [Candidatus Acidoferrales bacterium]
MILLMGLTPTLEAPLVARASVAKAPMKVWYGDASWYGPTFQGRTTASGELYDMTAFTAAHISLPFGAMVRLINTRNGKSAVVRINDRGPFVGGREIDVSYQAAEKLGLISRGVSKLRIELLEVPKRP